MKLEGGTMTRTQTRPACARKRNEASRHILGAVAKSTIRSGLHGHTEAMAAAIRVHGRERAETSEQETERDKTVPPGPWGNRAPEVPPTNENTRWEFSASSENESNRSRFHACTCKAHAFCCISRLSWGTPRSLPPSKAKGCGSGRVEADAVTVIGSYHQVTISSTLVHIDRSRLRLPPRRQPRVDPPSPHSRREHASTLQQWRNELTLFFPLPTFPLASSTTYPLEEEPES